MISTSVIAAGMAVGACLGAVWVSTPEASANPLTCEHRSSAHLAEHGGKAADDAYHLQRGEPANCDEESDRKRDDDREWRRDNFGFHCTWRGWG